MAYGRPGHAAKSTLRRRGRRHLSIDCVVSVDGVGYSSAALAGNGIDDTFHQVQAIGFTVGIGEHLYGGLLLFSVVEIQDVQIPIAGQNIEEALALSGRGYDRR